MLADKIIDVMEEFDISDLNINNTQLKFKTKNVKQGMSKKFLLENLTHFYNGDLEKAINTFDYLDSKRKFKETNKLIQYKNKRLISN